MSYSDLKIYAQSLNLDISACFNRGHVFRLLEKHELFPFPKPLDLGSNEEEELVQSKTMQRRRKRVDASSSVSFNKDEDIKKLEGISVVTEQRKRLEGLINSKKEHMMLYKYCHVPVYSQETKEAYDQLESELRSKTGNTDDFDIIGQGTNINEINNEISLRIAELSRDIANGRESYAFTGLFETHPFFTTFNKDSSEEENPFEIPDRRLLSLSSSTLGETIGNLEMEDEHDRDEDDDVETPDLRVEQPVLNRYGSQPTHTPTAEAKRSPSQDSSSTWCGRQRETGTRRSISVARSVSRSRCPDSRRSSMVSMLSCSTRLSEISRTSVQTPSSIIDNLVRQTTPKVESERMSKRSPSVEVVKNNLTAASNGEQTKHERIPTIEIGDVFNAKAVAVTKQKPTGIRSMNGRYYSAISSSCSSQSVEDSGGSNEEFLSPTGIATTGQTESIKNLNNKK
eukprot:UN04962